jgi:hypothetical protein
MTLSPFLNSLPSLSPYGAGAVNKLKNPFNLMRLERCVPALQQIREPLREQLAKSIINRLTMLRMLSHLNQARR